ncbi:hypothetical protein [Corynebacterium endometrii]|uniref:Uncharacterized protein n=1 Tax=Corynebacterium endometrii TaxID=2488819 RepID=A0A4V1CED0_9CORY|nr:hypothetical protein [Corynebacterium endometrii]QCB27678.1 hypothetical protein CENDO_01900 [Corynebacterium endometrii]
MLDPTRIEPTLDALRRAWEGQPDLSLSTLFGILAGQGVGWGASDEALIQALDSMSAQHPPLLPLGADGLAKGAWLATCNGGRVMVTLTRDSSGAACVIVRRRDKSSTSPGQPVVWKYAGLRPAGPGRPLVIKDMDGIEHRLGVVDLLTAVRTTTAPAAELEGRTRRRIGDSCYVIRTTEGLLLLERRAYNFTTGRRTVDCDAMEWSRVEQCRPGQPLILALPGGRQRDCGAVEEVFLAQ